MRSSASTFSDIAVPSRYDLLFRLAAGGTAAVHLGRLRGIAGFSRLVAIKVAHAHLDDEPLSREMMIEEATLASQIYHPNVVPVIDIAAVDGRLLLVMDYIEGASLADLHAASPLPMPPRVAMRVALDACAGLRAAHELSDAFGQSLGVVHRDVSPHNILVGSDGVTRLTDFGIAKTTSMVGRSMAGALKGKLAYMAPEYVSGSPANAGSDVFGLAVVVWEMLAGRRLFLGDNGHETLRNVLDAEAPPLASVTRSLGREVDVVLATALAKNPHERFYSAKEFGMELETAARRAGLVATVEEVSAFVGERLGEQLGARRRRIADLIAATAHGRDEPPSAASFATMKEVTGQDAVDPPLDATPPVPESSSDVVIEDQPPTLPSAEMSPAVSRRPLLLLEPQRDELPTLPSAEMATVPSVEMPPTASLPPAPPRRSRPAFAAVALIALLAGGLVKAVWPSEASSAPLTLSVPAVAPACVPAD